MQLSPYLIPQYFHHCKRNSTPISQHSLIPLLPIYFLFLNFNLLLTALGFPGGSAGKESTCNAGNLCSISWVGKIPRQRERPPTPVFWPGEFHGLYRPWGCKSQTRLRDFHFHFSFLTALNLHCCARTFSGCSKQGLLWIAVHRFLIAAVSLAAERRAHGLQ